MIDKRIKTFNIIIQIGCILFLIMMISGIVAPRFFKQIAKPPRNPVYSQMNVIKYAINTYKLNTGSLPQTLEDLLVCPKKLENSWVGPYLNESQLHDPWDNMFVYEPNTLNPNSYVILSYGADGLPSGEGYDADILNY